MSADPYAYVGEELDLFERATTWKQYWARYVARHVRGDVLEVGAGTGNNLGVLTALDRHQRWTSLEPDPSLLAALRTRLAEGGYGEVETALGTTTDLEPDRQFDTVLYIDVLEHIEDDAAEVARAAARLRPGGCLVVLGPAHPALFSPFDAAVGHYRRYTARSLRALRPPGLRCLGTWYLDAAGMALSAANRLLLRQSSPTPAQIAAWDRWVVPVSRRLDPLLGHRVGKSVLAVWER